MTKEFGFHTVVVIAFLGAHLPWALASNDSTIPIKVRENGRLLLPVGLNGGQDNTFLLDTGATITVISERLATKAGVARQGTARLQTSAGLVPLALARVDKIKIGGRLIEGQAVLIGDLGRLFRLDGDIEGILGQDILSRFNYILDRRHRKLEIEGDSDAGIPSGTRLSFERRGGKIYVRAAGGALRLMLDSGSAYLILFEDAVRELHPVVLDSGGTEVMSSLVGRREFLMALIPDLPIGDTRLRNVQALLTARQSGRYEDGFLPLHFFDSIYINNTGNFLILNPERAR